MSYCFHSINYYFNIAKHLKQQHAVLILQICHINLIV